MEDIDNHDDRVIVMNHGELAMNGTVDEVFSHASDLQAMGLNVPEITRVFTALHDKGFDVPPNIYSVKEGVRILRALLEGGVG